MPAAAATNSPAGDVVEVVNPSGGGKIVLLCEHASNFIPPEFGGLGLAPEVLTTHVAWDPGARAVAGRLSTLLDAPLVASRVSRLVYDCNRAEGAAGAVPETSEVYDIPGNRRLSDEDRRARRRKFCEPFHEAVALLLDRRLRERRETAIVTVHTFTPVYFGRRRDVDLGVLYDADARLADALMPALEAPGGLDVRRNAPYGASDGVTYSLVRHALTRGLANVMLEIRNDLVAGDEAQNVMAARLAEAMAAALDCLAARDGRTAHA